MHSKRTHDARTPEVQKVGIAVVIDEKRYFNLDTVDGVVSAMRYADNAAGKSQSVNGPMIPVPLKFNVAMEVALGHCTSPTLILGGEGGMQSDVTPWPYVGWFMQCPLQAQLQGERAGNSLILGGEGGMQSNVTP